MGIVLIFMILAVTAIMILVPNNITFWNTTFQDTNLTGRKSLLGTKWKWYPEKSE